MTANNVRSRTGAPLEADRLLDSTKSRPAFSLDRRCSAAMRRIDNFIDERVAAEKARVASDFQQPREALARHACADEFPARIMALLREVADRKGTEHTGPWEDGNGEPMQDDADAAIAWITARAPTANTGER